MNPADGFVQRINRQYLTAAGHHVNVFFIFGKAIIKADNLTDVILAVILIRIANFTQFYDLFK